MPGRPRMHNELLHVSLNHSGFMETWRGIGIETLVGGRLPSHSRKNY